MVRFLPSLSDVIGCVIASLPPQFAFLHFPLIHSSSQSDSIPIPLSSSSFFIIFFAFLLSTQQIFASLRLFACCSTPHSLPLSYLLFCCSTNRLPSATISTPYLSSSVFVYVYVHFNCLNRYTFQVLNIILQRINAEIIQLVFCTLLRIIMSSSAIYENWLGDLQNVPIVKSFETSFWRNTNCKLSIQMLARKSLNDCVNILMWIYW